MKQIIETKRARSKSDEQVGEENKNKVLKMDPKEMSENIMRLLEQGKRTEEALLANTACMTKVLTKYEQLENELTETKTKMTQLEAKVNNLEQAALATSFRITGLPSLKPDVDAWAIADNFFKIVGCPVPRENLRSLSLHVHRNGKASHIAGEFYSLQQRDQLTKAYLERKKKEAILFATIVPNLAPDNPAKARKITLKGLLTQASRKLLEEARAQGDKVDYVFESKGRIIMKKGGKIRTINCPSDITEAVTFFGALDDNEMNVD